ncbi:MAG: acetate uptake transporter [Solirubrobacteraceae bacterium]
MEANRLPPSQREADLVPDEDPTQSHSGHWTPSDPAPLGLAAFATTTFALSIINANLVSATALPMVAIMALTFGGIGQLIAGIWEFRTGNTFGATVFTAYGTFWISFFFLVIVALPLVPKTEADAAIGLYLWSWTLFTLLILVASLRTTGAIAFTLVLLVITFVLLAIGYSSLVGGTAATNGTLKLGGYFGIATALAAWYVSFAGLSTAVFGRQMLPVFPLTR